MNLPLNLHISLYASDLIWCTFKFHFISRKYIYLNIYVQLSVKAINILLIYGIQHFALFIRGANAQLQTAL